MKKLGTLLLVGAIAVTLATPGHAAGPYRIATTSGLLVNGALVFTAADCNPALDGSPIDGVDTAIVNVAGRGGTTLKITWSGDTTLAHAGGQRLGSLTPKFFGADCTPKFNSESSTTKSPGVWNLPVPPGTKWMLITSNAFRDVSFSFP